MTIHALSADLTKPPIASRCNSVEAMRPNGDWHMLEQEFDYYRAHQADFVAKYAGKVIVILDCKVVGVFDDELHAVNEASKKYPLGTFLVQRVEPGSESTTQIFHSRVAFA